MSKYNYFFTSEATVTPIGKKIIEYQNNYFIKLIKEYIEKSDNTLSILEIGPGKGYFAMACQSNGFHYEAVEENEIGVKNLRENGVKVYRSSVPPIPGNKKYDCIFMNQVLEHMPSLVITTQLVNDCSKKLNSGGILLIGCPDILTHKEYFYNDYTHSYPTSIVRLRRLLNDFELTPIYDKYYTFFFKGYVLTRIITILTITAKRIGVLDILFKKKSDKILSSLLPSFIIIGKKLS
jgi:2-polyprenyl-3-methyl-5-hydroxy-6-metoxy-1,4-benzoquinol methylase